MTETASPADALVDLFSRVADRIATAHGPALYRTEKLFARPGEEPFLTAVWSPGGLNHGFKLYASETLAGDPLVRILTWAHAGPLCNATALVEPELAEEIVLALLPPAIRPAAEPADHIEHPFAEYVGRRVEFTSPDGVTVTGRVLVASNGHVIVDDGHGHLSLPLETITTARTVR
jgi:hypothetical protein